MSQFLWLASYPKSGNTWLRAFLANLNRRQDPADINNLGLEGATVASNRRWFDLGAGVPSTCMSSAEIERWRAAALAEVAGRRKEALIWLKIHDAWLPGPNGGWPAPVANSRGVIYIVRNPLDVAASFANHLGCSVSQAIEHLNNPEYGLSGSWQRPQEQFPQRLSDWSGHVSSWLEQKQIPLHLMRYEDMLADPLASFSAALHFIGLQATPAQVEKAIEFSSFRSLRRQEEEKGFREKTAVSQAFFRKGQSGGWRSELTPAQVQSIFDHHRPMMERFGYTDEIESGV